MKKQLVIFLSILAVTGLILGQSQDDFNVVEQAPKVAPPPAPTQTPKLDKKAVVIEVEDMVDEGLYESIRRRTEAALGSGADYIIYQMDTFGGRLDSGIKIYDYFLKEVKPRAHTVAFIPTKAISAGALISVACQDIIMEDVSKIGDCAPITMGGTLEGVEREKIETTLRSYFADAAQANSYPSALLRAMVTVGVKVYRVKNLSTGQYDYFTEEELPTDKAQFDLEGKKLIDGPDSLVTLNAREATEYGISRAVVADLEGALRFLEERDGVIFQRPAPVLPTTWSEELVRWLASPTVTGILVLVVMACFYFEMKTGGLGLAAIVGVAALALLLGSKFLIGMANWWEIAAIIIGLGLIAVEIFLIPGFGIAGVAGIILLLLGLIGIMVENPPDRLPIPESTFDKNLFISQLRGMVLAMIGFFVAVYIINKYFSRLPGFRLMDRLVLATPEEPASVRTGITEGQPEEAPAVRIGARGQTASVLRPAGVAKFNHRRVEVVSRGEMIEAGQEIMVVTVEGNRIVVKQVS